MNSAPFAKHPQPSESQEFNGPFVDSLEGSTFEAYPELASANRLITKVVELGEAWADADASASSLEETKRTLLAKLTVEHIRGGALASFDGSPGSGTDSTAEAARSRKSLSKAEAELRATADPRYVEHLERMVTARQHSNRMRVRYDLGKMQIELSRSIHATRRQEMRFSGMSN